MQEEKYNTKDIKHIDKKSQEYIAEGNKMTEEIKYYKEKEYPLKWIPAEEMEKTPQQTIERLEQENKELKIYIESNKQQVEKVEMLVMDNDRLQQEVEDLKDTIITMLRTTALHWKK